MPFTLAHPAAVLPLHDRGLPMTAMVAGAMVPDLPQLLSFTVARDLSHSLLGVVTIDLGMGMVALVLWYAVYRRPLADLAFDPWRDRLPDAVAMDLRTWLLSVPAVALGAATHVVWDAFTHEGGFGVEHLPFLEASYRGVAVFDVLQLAFSAVAFAWVLWVTWRHLSRLPAREPRPAPVVGRWSLVVALATAALLGMGFAALLAPYGLEAAVYYGVVTPMLAAGFGVTCVCVWWQVKFRWPSRSRTPTG
jgi:hypothetical protein